MGKKIGWIVGAFLVIVLIAVAGGAFSETAAPSTTTSTTTTTEPATTYVVDVWKGTSIPLVIQNIETEESAVLQGRSIDSEVVCGGNLLACEEIAREITERSEIGRVWVGPTRFSVVGGTGCIIEVLALDVRFRSDGDLDSVTISREESTKRTLVEIETDDERETCEAVWPPED